MFSSPLHLLQLLVESIRKQVQYDKIKNIKMPRRSSGRAPARQQTRSSHSMAAPAPSRSAPHPPPSSAPSHAPAQQRQPGLFSQMASTAAGVAVGSAVGHTLANGVSSIFGGGSNEVAAAPVETQQQEQRSVNCEVDARNFTRCLDENGGNMQICDWYLQQLKACQEAARSY